MTRPFRNTIVLHCHLPWLRHADVQHCPEEDWGLDVITESLLPQLEMLHNLKQEGLPFQLTLAITPTVLAMLRDPLMQERTKARLERSLNLALAEIERGSDPDKRTLTQWYADHYHHLHHYFCDRWTNDLASAIRDLRESGHLEVTASAATHALLPLFLKSPEVLRTQIQTGCDFYEECFNERPDVFWLPDCAFSPALEPYLSEAGITHILLNEQALTYSAESEECSIYQPAQTPGGLQVSCRDIASSLEILQLEAGLVHDTRYREATMMSGIETPVNALNLHYIANHDNHAALKIHCMDSDQLYIPSEGKMAAQEHAGHLLEARAAQFASLKERGISRPRIVSVYECAMFGHWRFEGIPFLEETLRQFAEHDEMELTHLVDKKQQKKTKTSADSAGVFHPIPSSWGEGDYFEHWLSQENAWIYPHLLRRSDILHRTIDTLSQSIEDIPDDLANHRSRCICQMTRELLLAQASDWAALMRHPNTRSYATRRFETHLENFDALATLYSSLEEENATRLATIEKLNPIYPDLEWNSFTRTRDSI